jgi:hypothetical protein
MWAASMETKHHQSVSWLLHSFTSLMYSLFVANFTSKHYPNTALSSSHDSSSKFFKTNQEASLNYHFNSSWIHPPIQNFHFSPTRLQWLEHNSPTRRIAQEFQTLNVSRRYLRPAIGLRYEYGCISVHLPPRRYSVRLSLYPLFSDIQEVTWSRTYHLSLSNLFQGCDVWTLRTLALYRALPSLESTISPVRLPDICRIVLSSLEVPT